ncbi:MAG TPA: 2-phospho-L-lactate guanylyltransferase [Acidimicrobiales bacterium]|nr:2-phospho-L-lactate guanylyltransferase [Acidimicrobiales bacterium]
MTGAGPAAPGVAVLVPVKAFCVAKARLAPAMSGEAREALVREMAEAVVRAARPLPVSVVCDDAAVAAWASSLGAGVVWTPARGLNGAVTHGIAVLAEGGATTVIVAHADLPLATELAPVADFEGVTIVPDRRDDGTNVAAVPSTAGFRFSYGPGSFARHVAECQRLGLPLRVVREPLLTWDVDLPVDLVPG